MDFRFSEQSLARQEQMEDFFRAKVLPRNHEWQAHVAKHGTAPPFLEDAETGGARPRPLEHGPA